MCVKNVYYRVFYTLWKQKIVVSYLTEFFESVILSIKETNQFVCRNTKHLEQLKAFLWKLNLSDG